MRTKQKKDVFLHVSVFTVLVVNMERPCEIHETARKDLGGLEGDTLIHNLGGLEGFTLTRNLGDLEGYTLSGKLGGLEG